MEKDKYKDLDNKIDIIKKHKEKAEKVLRGASEYNDNECAKAVMELCYICYDLIIDLHGKMFYFRRDEINKKGI